jgi:hypothetical protein
MKDILHAAVEIVNDVAEQNQMIVHWMVPECDDMGHSVLVQNSDEVMGLVYHNAEEPDTPVQYYILEVELYTWLLLEGFTDDDIFESGDFEVLHKVELTDFCIAICSSKKNTRKSDS